MFKYLSNCLKLLKQYYSTPKGHHDILDYSRAFFLIYIFIYNFFPYFNIYFLLKLLKFGDIYHEKRDL